MPKVSVIIPIYNTEKYLKQCIDSVVNQTLKDIEIIAVNDGSTDGTLSILEMYAKNDNRIKIISKPNAGYGHSMNVGLDNASGEYIGIVEADDFAQLDMFETLYNIAKENNVEIAKANYMKYFSKKDYYAMLNVFPEPLFDVVFNPSEYCYLLSQIHPFIWSAVYKNSFLTDNAIRFNETPGASYQDASFEFFVWASAKSAYFINKPLINYRSDNENASTNSVHKAFCIFDEYKRMDEFADSHIDKKVFWITRNYRRFHDYLFHYNRIARQYKTDFLKRFSSEFRTLKDNGVLPKELFKKKEWKNVNLIINHYFIFHIKTQMYLTCRNFLESILSIKNDEKFKVINILGFRFRYIRSKSEKPEINDKRI
jgi:glycosyltransferase involved in cell wall biosynthesis